ncbi:MAG: YeeE/YedE thiosulfate transporter family protein [Xanthomonadales bacterium]|nr:YeeE/YedE thiosulfate transporter family protein [Xanthomonadales bacterium]
MKLFMGFLIGCAFGAILQLGGASSYRKIMGALLLKDMTIIKLICTAIAVGTIGIYALDLADMAKLDVKPTYVVGIAIAGLIFGAGFAISGYCPGTCVVASAEGKTDAMVTVLGGLVGALLYALAYPMFKGLIEVTNYGKVTLASVANIDGIWIALPLSIGLLVLSFLVLKDRYGSTA